MKSLLSHVYLYVPDLKKTYRFYKDFLEYLGYQQIAKEKWGFAFINNGTSLWFEQAPKKYINNQYHRCHPGLNHLAFRVESRKAVDKFYQDFLKSNDIPTLYDTPKLFPEYSKDYYAVFFEDPMRLKIEVNYYD